MRIIKNLLSGTIFCAAIVAAGTTPAGASTRPPGPEESFEIFDGPLFLLSAQKLSDDLLEGPMGMALRAALLNQRRPSPPAPARPDLPPDLPLEEISSISSIPISVQNQRRSLLELASNNGLRQFYFDPQDWDEARSDALRKAVTDPRLKSKYTLVLPPPGLTASPVDIKVRDKKTRETWTLPEFLHRALLDKSEDVRFSDLIF